MSRIICELHSSLAHTFLRESISLTCDVDVDIDIDMNSDSDSDGGIDIDIDIDINVMYPNTLPFVSPSVSPFLSYRS